MSSILIFAGTTEGRLLSAWLCDQKMPHLLCVATAYGRQLLPENPYAQVRTGRLDREEMTELMRKEGVRIVVDATHPYALEAAKNIRTAAQAAGTDYLRLDRYQPADSGPENAPADEKNITPNDNQPAGRSLNPEMPAEMKTGHMRYFPDLESCRQALAETEGSILLTTGSKDLPLWCRDAAVKDRLVVRVLPGTESIRICEEAGIAGSRIIAMQGPFSEEMNLALLHAFDIRTMVTKESGNAGGFAAKCMAAEKAGAAVFVLSHPEREEGKSFSEVCRILLQYREPVRENNLSDEPARHGYLSDEPNQEEYRTDVPAQERQQTDIPRRTISLIGCGMGTRAAMTVEAVCALKHARLVFGAGRLLTDCAVTQKSLPYYLAKDILPVLKETKEDAAILFSGDSGFYSGAANLYSALQNAAAAGELIGEIRIFPGISSVSALAARFGISWENAAILSIHGKGGPERWSGKVRYAVRSHAQTFLLLSGVKDLQTVGDLLLQDKKLRNCRVLAGYQMGSGREEMLELTPEQCLTRKEEGLYSIFIRNDKPEAPPATHGLPDSAFIRGKVPMTKEEVRAVSIAKLQLRKNSIVYDIGSGTGSIAAEIARLSPDLRVYAIERRPEAAALIRENAARFSLNNLHVVEADAPEGLADLPAPTHVFLGGTGNKMKEILQILYKKTDNIRFAANAVTLETLRELQMLEKEENVKDFSMVCVSAARTREAGSYHMMQAENPVWIASWERASRGRIL